MRMVGLKRSVVFVLLAASLLPGLAPARSLAAPPGVALPGAAAYPENITAAADGTLYVSSFVSGGVMRVRPGALEAEPFIKPGALRTRSTLGVLADERSGTLWVCSMDLSALGIPSPGEGTGSALAAFDLATGESKFSVALPSPGMCNDIALGSDGSAYVTNTLAPQILRLPPGSRMLEVWATDPRFGPGPKEAGLDGLAFGPDGDLLVDTFSKAELFRVKVRDGVAGEVTPLATSRPLVLADGLRASDDGTFLLAEGGGSLDRVTIVGDKARIDTLRGGIAGGATGVAQVGGVAWVTEGQLAVLTDPARKSSGPLLPFRIIAVPLTNK